MKLSTIPSCCATSPRHFVFMLPETTTVEEQHEVAESARALLPDGYVYIITPHVKSTEDREEIRYMPFHRDALPAFGEVAGVLVANDATLARQAREVYQDTPVMVFEPGKNLQPALFNPKKAHRSTLMVTTTRTEDETLRQAA